MGNVLDGIKNVKNADKIIIGAKAYDEEEHKWGTIVGYEEESDDIIMENDDDYDSTWYVTPCFVHPIAEGYHLNIDEEVVVCYELGINALEQFYVPEYNKGFFDFEVTHDSDEYDCTNYNECVIETICKKLASDMQDMTNDEDGNFYGTIYYFFYHVLKTKANADKVAFIKEYVDADAERLYEQIVSNLVDIAFTNLLPCIDNIDNNEGERIANKIEKLPILDIIRISMATPYWLIRYRARLGVDKYSNTKNKYKVEGVHTEKLYVEVEAETWEEAKQIAQDKLNAYPISENADIILVNSESKVKHWSKKRNK